jgi:hypothetical protein
VLRRYSLFGARSRCRAPDHTGATGWQCKSGSGKPPFAIPTETKSCTIYLLRTGASGCARGLPTFTLLYSLLSTLYSLLWTLDSGLWTLDSGLWTLDSGLWTLDSGLWTLDSGLWTLDFTFCERGLPDAHGGFQPSPLSTLYSWLTRQVFLFAACIVDQDGKSTLCCKRGLPDANGGFQPW